jgi:siderophore synthetase component
MPLSTKQQFMRTRDVAGSRQPTVRALRAPVPHEAGVGLPALERRLIEQYFNTYCRETEQFDPRITGDVLLIPALRRTVDAWRRAGYECACVRFPHDRSILCVALEHYSQIGFHRLGPYAVMASADDQVVALDGPDPLLVQIAKALDYRFPAVDPERPRQFATMMRNSVSRVRYYHAKQPDPAATVFIHAEQSLRFGHAFHVTSKALDGFGEHDLHAYAPELGASFQLHYLAVSNRLLEVRSIDNAPLPIDPVAMKAASALLGDSEYRLMPCHPWQARNLLQQLPVMKLLAGHELISLGPLGDVVWPTSSVRTVWLPEQRRFMKLPLDVRITNFVRNNPPEQVRRAVDASRYIAALPREWRDAENFEILLDSGSMTLAAGDAALQASTAIVYRDAMRDGQGLDARVLASLLEEAVDGVAPLQHLLTEALGMTPSFEQVTNWWTHYLDVTLMPLLRLFACEGVSLEAHLQNSMVAFQNGWPVRGYVRDMEGASISRTRCTLRDALAPDSPAFYDDEQAWMRLRYYVLVNHIGHFIACIARAGVCDETALWRITAQVWQCDPRPEMVELLADVCRRPALPAKANMLSCYGEHGETPAWVDIPNPLFNRERDA